MNKILSRLFGNKIKIVTAERSNMFGVYRQTFIFNGYEKDRNIKDMLWNYKKFIPTYIQKVRAKEIVQPAAGYAYSHSKEDMIFQYD